MDLYYLFTENEIKCEKDYNKDKKKILTFSSVETFPIQGVDKVNDFMATSFQSDTGVFLIQIQGRAIVFLKIWRCENMSAQ